MRITLARPAKRRKSIDNGRGKPDLLPAVGVGLRLVADGPERHGRGNGVEGGLTCGDSDHGRPDGG